MIVILYLSIFLTAVVFTMMAWTVWLGAFHPNRQHLRPHLNRLAWFSALLFASFFFLPSQLYALELFQLPGHIYVIGGLSLFLYDLWILRNRNKIGHKSPLKAATAAAKTSVPFLEN